MNKIQRPPGPKGRPLIGSLDDFLKNPPYFLRDVSRRYGDIAYYRLGQKHIYHVNHPDLIRETLVGKADCLEKTAGLDRFKRVMGQGLVTAPNAVHDVQRRLMQPAFRRERMRSYGGMIVSKAERFNQAIRQDGTVDIQKSMTEVTLSIIGTALFGVHLEPGAIEKELIPRLQVIAEYVEWLTHPFSDVLDKLPLPRTLLFRHSEKSLRNFIFSIIERRRQGAKAAEETDILSALLSLRGENGAQLNDEQLYDEAITLFLAGHETVATALTWTWLLLSQHPKIQERFHEEIDQVLKGKLPTEEDAVKLTYTRQILSESMRLYPPVWVLTREVSKEFMLGGFRLTPGARLSVSQFVMHRDERFWPQPLVFDPGRWTAEAAKQRPPYCYFPFGGGPRSCIGEPMAWMEAILVLATIGQEWRVKLSRDYEPQFKPLITLQAKNLPPMVFEKRGAPSKLPNQ